MTTNTQHQVLIVGGATTKVDVVVIEPSTVHYYQPAFSLAGGTSFSEKSKNLAAGTPTWFTGSVLVDPWTRR